MFEDVLFEDRKVSLNTMEDFEKFKKKAAENPMPNPIFVGTIETKSLCNMGGHLVMTPTEMKDPDGEVVSIKNLNLVLCGSLADDLPTIQPKQMKDFAVAVARTATYQQRHLPIWQKLVLLWKVFAELFLNKSYITEGDPYVMVANQWYRKQLIPAPAKLRLKILWRRIRDMFVYTPDAEPIDTFGMPGFQTFKRTPSSQTF